MWGQYVQSFCVCLCVFASVGVCHWWSWRLLLLLWEIHPHTPISPSSLSLSPSPPPSCCIKEMGGKGTFVTLLSLTHRDNHTAHRTHRPLGHTHIPLGHADHLEKKRLSVSAGSPQLEGLTTEKRRGENTITRSIIIYADRLRRFAGTAHTFGESVSHLSSRGGRRSSSHEDFQPDLPAAAARGSSGIKLLCQTRYAMRPLQHSLTLCLFKEEKLWWVNKCDLTSKSNVDDRAEFKLFY